MNPRFSVVAPIWNEENLIEEFYRRVREVMEGLDSATNVGQTASPSNVEQTDSPSNVEQTDSPSNVGQTVSLSKDSWELILVDDGSYDRSPQLMDEIHARDPDHVVVLHFARNFGHQLAITAGMDYARGDAVIVIDSDLQDPPEVIPDLIAKWREGYEVVYAVRTEREGETWFKLATARLFYRLIQILTDVEIPMEAGDFRLLDRNALDTLKRMRERHRFVRAMVSWIGFRQVGVPYRRMARKAGETKYTFRRMFRLALDAITGFSFFPLKLALWAGMIAMPVGLLVALVLLVIRLGGAAPLAGQGLVTSLVLFMGGVQLLGLGILGEYIGRIYDEVRRRPLYILREIVRKEE